MTDTIAEPHYAKVPGFDKRTDAEFSLAQLRAKSLDHYFKLDLAPPRPENTSLVRYRRFSVSIGAIDISPFSARAPKMKPRKFSNVCAARIEVLPVAS